MASTTTQTIWQRLARGLGSHIAVNATSDVVVGPDTARWFISFVLKAQTATREGHFATVTGTTNIQQNLRVLREVPAVGALALSDLSGSGTWLTNSTIEVVWPLPIFNTESITGLVTLIQYAARDIYYEDTLNLTPGAGVYTVDMSAYKDWLTEDLVCRDDQGRPFYYDPPLVTGYPQQHKPARYGELNFVAGVPSLRLVQAYGDSLDSNGPAQLCVLRPAYSLVSGAESTTGPSSAAQTIGADATEVVEVAKLKAYEYLQTATHISVEERQRYAGLVEPQRAYVRSIVKHYRPRPQAATERAA